MLAGSSPFIIAPCNAKTRSDSETEQAPAHKEKQSLPMKAKNAKNYYINIEIAAVVF